MPDKYDKLRFPIECLRSSFRGSFHLYPKYLYIKKRLTTMDHDPINLLPSKDTDLHIAGFPRTANTFAVGLIKKLLPQVNIANHIHTKATIKLAIKNDVPTLVLIRDPREAVSSIIIKR